MARLQISRFLNNFIVENKYGKPPIVPWPRTTISLSKIVCFGNAADPIYKILENSDDVHAEERLIEDLQKDTNVIAAKKVGIQVYQNYSPCSRCADTIVGYMTGMRLLKKKIKMNITFANFYKIHEYEGRRRGNSRQNAERNIEGLRWLVNSGVKLELFGVHQEWESFLGMTEFFGFLDDEEKKMCLERANSRARKLREETDERFLQEEIYEEDTQLPER